MTTIYHTGGSCGRGRRPGPPPRAVGGRAPSPRTRRVPARAISVIENWAPLDELPALPRENAWSNEHGLNGRTVYLYSGTLGFKHDPELLLELARWARGRDDVLVVVVSEGVGADWLAEQRRDEPALRLLPYQPYERLPEVVASADVLVGVLEREAGRFSVPSKVLTYLCAGRPLLVAVAAENLAARVVERSGGGVVVPPGDAAALVSNAAALLDDPRRREQLGRAARAYAEQAFDVESLAARFEAVFRAAIAARRQRRVRSAAAGTTGSSRTAAALRLASSRTGLPSSCSRRCTCRACWWCDGGSSRRSAGCAGPSRGRRITTLLSASPSARSVWRTSPASSATDGSRTPPPGRSSRSGGGQCGAERRDHPGRARRRALPGESRPAARCPPRARRRPGRRRVPLRRHRAGSNGARWARRGRCRDARPTCW